MDSSAAPPLSLMVQRSLAQTPAQVWAAWTTSAGIAGWGGRPAPRLRWWISTSPRAASSALRRRPPVGPFAPPVSTYLHRGLPRAAARVHLDLETGDDELVNRPTQLRVQLELDHDGGTRIRVEQAGFPDSVSRDRHIEGWRRALEGLARITTTQTGEAGHRPVAAVIAGLCLTALDGKSKLSVSGD